MNLSQYYYVKNLNSKILNGCNKQLPHLGLFGTVHCLRITTTVFSFGVMGGSLPNSSGFIALQSPLFLPWCIQGVVIWIAAKHRYWYCRNLLSYVGIEFGSDAWYIIKPDRDFSTNSKKREALGATITDETL